MYHDSWVCVTVEKGPGLITDEVRTVLKMAACDLHLKRWDRMHIISDMCAGLIQTKWETHSLGGASGVLFRAQVERDEGDYQVNFLLNERDLKRGARFLREIEEEPAGNWEQIPQEFEVPIPELYRFYDLRAGGSRKMH